MQAQDQRGFRLAIRSRSTGLTAADVDRALTDDRSMVVSWLNRGTLHLVAAEDYWWLRPLTTPQLATANNRRLGQEGVNESQADRGVDVVMDAVSRDGPLTRTQLRERLDDAGVPTAGQALVHVLFAASLRADLVRGPVVGGDQAFVSATGWLGPPPPALDRDDALAALARRYLAGHAPATAEDLAKWAGVTLTVARRALALAGEVAVDPAAPFPPPLLLGAFDPLLLGWASREPVVGSHAGVVTNNGLFRPVALVKGRAVATWGLAGGVVTLRPLETIGASVQRKLAEDAADVVRFLGLPAKQLAELITVVK